MKPGDTIWVRTYKADGQPHRWWQTLVEAIGGECYELAEALLDVLANWRPLGPTRH